jgi:hypothetical protein
MQTLFLFYLGGIAPGANIEIHDVQFAACNQPEDAFPLLVERWFGTKESLHVDAYAKIEWADGYDVLLLPQPNPAAERLYFINLGGYIPGELQEAHSFSLFVAKDEQEAKARAKRSLLTDVNSQHRDNQMDVDDCLLLSEVQGLHVHLKANPNGRPLRADWQGYRPIG